MSDYYKSLNIDTQWKNLKDQFYENYKKLTAEDKKDPDIEETHKYYSRFKNTSGDFTKAKKVIVTGALIAATALRNKINKSKKKEKTEEEKRKEKMDDILNKIEKDASVFNTLDNDYKENKKFCLKAIRRNKDIFKYIPKKLINSKDLDIDFLIELLKENPEVFDIMFNNSKNKEFMHLLKNKEFITNIKETKKPILISQLNNFNYKMKRGLFF